MRFSCTNTDLLEAVTASQKASATNTSFPILEMLLIEAENDIKITGNNLEIAIEYCITGNIYNKGQIAVNAKIICEIIRRMPDGIIFFEVSGDNNVNIRCGELDFNITGLPAEDFPKIPSVDFTQSISADAETISALVKHTSFAVAQTDIKPMLTGIKIEMKEKEIKCIAVDGYRLAIKKAECENALPDCDCIVPGKSLIELCKILGNSKEKINIHLADKNILFEFENCKFFSRLLDGEFVNYMNILPKEYKYSAKIKVDDFIKSIDRAALLIESDGSKTPVRIIYDQDRITVLCNTQKGNVKDIIPVSADENETFEVGYNCKFLLDALRAADCEFVRLEIMGNINPTVIRPVENEDFIYIVVPVRLK